MITAETIYIAFVEKADHDTAFAQSKYMREKFPYLGLKAPVWKHILKRLTRSKGYPSVIADYALEAYAYDYREMHYSAIWMIERRIKTLDKDDIKLLEYLSTKHAWWDSIDWLAKCIGMHFMRYPDIKNHYITKWRKTDDLWLLRICIIFQLRYKSATNSTLLYDIIDQLSGHPDFFIQKAIGWSLRTYSKTNPDSVSKFIQNRTLSPLARREGMKYLP